MNHVRFNTTINVDGTTHEVGAVVKADTIARGSLASLIYTRNAEYCQAPPEPPKPAKIETAEVKTVAPAAAFKVKEKSEKVTT